MNWADSFETALRAISANKLRSALTMLGVIIGVGSVIAMIGIGEGTKRKSLEELEIMGSNRLSVMPNWGRSNRSDGMSTLRESDVEMLRRNVPTILRITGVINERGAQAKFGANNKRTTVSGATPDIQYIENARKMHSGGFYTDQDEAMMNRVAVLGWAVYEELYDGETAVGTTIKINGQSFEVVGVVDYKGGTGWRNPDDQIYVPYQTAKNRLTGQRDRVDYITIQAVNSEVLPVTQEDVEQNLLRTRVSASGEELFRVFNQAESLEAIQTQSQLLSMLLAGIASVSLLVGGIGIMNIMLVTVTERTKEIGLRKAIGAKRSTILSQFLYESVVLCVMGGVFGMGLGIFATRFVAEQLQVPPVVNMEAVMAAFIFSCAVGLFFGLYPAVRASRLLPMEALRTE